MISTPSPSTDDSTPVLTLKDLRVLFKDAGLANTTIPDELKNDTEVQKEALTAIANLITRGNIDGAQMIADKMGLKLDQVHNNPEIQGVLPAFLELQARHGEFYKAGLALPWLREKSMGLMTQLKTVAAAFGLKAARKHHGVLPDSAGMQNLVTEPYEAFRDLCVPNQK